MDATTRRYLLALRVNDLQDVCARLGLRKNGRKTELQQRIMSVFDINSGVPAAAYKVATAQRTIADAFNSINGVARYLPPLPHQQAPATATTAATPPTGGPAGGDPKRQRVGEPGSSSAVPRPYMLQLSAAAAGGAGASNTAIRCVCGLALERGAMLQCEGDNCHVWQHADCVGYCGKPHPAHFWCERCRVQRADPFWAPFEQVMVPAKLHHTGRMVTINNASVPQIMAERGFSLSSVQHELLRRKADTYQLRLFCVQLNDAVPFRFHWPLSSELTVNGIPLRPYNRSYNAKLGPNQRDEGVQIGFHANVGRNVVKLVGADSHGYVISAAIVRKLGIDDVKAMMQPPEPLPKALQRMQHQLRHPGSDTLSTDSDDEIEIGNSVLSLKDPLTGTRMAIPARFSDIGGLPTFDLDPFLVMAQRTLKWQDPHSLKSSCVQRLQVDAYVAAILAALEPHPTVTEVEVKPDGSWRPAGSSGRFLSVLDADAGDVFGADEAATAANGAAAAGGNAVKVEPGMEGANGAPPAAAAVAGDDDSEEEDPAEELRRAAAAVAAATAARRAKAAPAVEVIDLISDDEGDLGPFAAPAAQAAGAGAQLPPGLRAAPAAGPSAVQQQQGQQQRLQQAGSGGGDPRLHSHASAGPGPSSVANAAAAVGAMARQSPGGLRIRLPPRRSIVQQGQQGQQGYGSQQQGQQGHSSQQPGLQGLQGQQGQQLQQSVSAGAQPLPAQRPQITTGLQALQSAPLPANTAQLLLSGYQGNGPLLSHTEVLSPTASGYPASLPPANGNQGGSYPLQQLGSSPQLFMAQQQAPVQLLSLGHVQQQLQQQHLQPQQLQQQPMYSNGAADYAMPTYPTLYTQGSNGGMLVSTGSGGATQNPWAATSMQAGQLLHSQPQGLVMYPPVMVAPMMQQPSMATSGSYEQLGTSMSNGNGMYAPQQQLAQQASVPMSHGLVGRGSYVQPQQPQLQPQAAGLHTGFGGGQPPSRGSSPSIADLICLLDSD